MKKKQNDGSVILSGNLKKKKKMLIITNVVLSIILCLSTLSTTVLGAVWYYMGDMEKNEITSDSSALGIESEAAKLSDEIINIALFGTDPRGSGTKSRSDTIIILSVNPKNKTIKATSILRDSYVPIDGHKMQKICNAYFYGGPVLAINTINKNYKLNVTDYITVNFMMLADIIDIMGGVDLEITEKERKQINWLISTEDFSSTYKTETVKEAGMVHLNGKQALHYSRIRKIDSDVIRVQRQIKVLNILLEKVKNMSVTKYPSVLKSVMKHVETSLSYSEIIAYAPLVSSFGQIESTAVPDQKKDKNVWGGNYAPYNNQWIWIYDIAAAADRIHEFIYGDDNADSTSDTSSNTNSNVSSNTSSVKN